jgi:hypothetical protein
MSTDNLIVSVEEARKILGSEAVCMTDDEIIEVVSTLNIMAKGALETARSKLRMKKDAKEFATLIYDIYQDKKRLENNSDNKI